MLPTLELLRSRLATVLADKKAQGHVTTGLPEELDALPDSYDAMAEFARKIADLPLRDDWPYVEPNEIDEIRAECVPDRPLGAMCEVDLKESAMRAEAAFLGSVCGCILGKPLEFNPTLAELHEGLSKIGEWPVVDYISGRAKDVLRSLHASWPQTTRENIQFVAPDDDIHYTILGMLLVEKHGIRFSRENIRDLWLSQLPITMTFGPERTMLLKAGIHSLSKSAGIPAEWVAVLNPRDEFCGALIRADAFGYACPGRPELAAELAWRDAGWTHRRTGIYGAMFVAAAIAIAHVVDDSLGVFEVALKFVPQRSRFHRIAADCLDEIRRASDWMDGYKRINRKYERYTHCQIYQEVGTLMNTLRFAEDVGDGICKQVMQGNDTDSFGATAGSLLGAFFGPGHLGERWLAPFNDEIRTCLAEFYERSLSAVAARMGRLPERVAADLMASAL